jgi:predicted secreted protein
MSTAAISAKGASLRRFATVSTNGTAVTWVSGTQFTSALTAQSVTIGATPYTFTYVSATSGTLSVSAGVQAAVAMTTTVLWGEVAEVTAINGMALKQDTLDVTSHQSPGAWREFIAVLRDAGEIQLDLNFVPTDASQNYTIGLGKDQTTQQVRAFSLVFPDNATDSLRTRWSVNALVTSFQPKAPVAAALTATLTLKVTGQPVLA